MRQQWASKRAEGASKRKKQAKEASEAKRARLSLRFFFLPAIASLASSSADFFLPLCFCWRAARASSVAERR